MIGLNHRKWLELPCFFHLSSSVPSLRMINIVLHYESYCPKLKKVNVFTVGSKKNFKQVPFLHEKGNPNCCLLSLCLYHTCASGGQSSSINYFSAISLAIKDWKEQKHLMAQRTSFNVPTLIFISLKVFDLISSALLFHLRTRTFFTLHVVK